MLLIRVAAALVCITLHELSHGYVAYRLGDDTARSQGRLTLNPIRHIDPFGLLMLVVAGVGWAKPVPVDMRNFQHPKRGMALTALAGPGANFVIALVALFLGTGLLHLNPTGALASVLYYILMFLIRCALLSVGLGIFNLFPIPPLDGSKVLFSLLPDRIYYNILRYERYVMLALFALVFFGVVDVPLQYAINRVLRLFCAVTGFPTGVFGL
ncbi:MAG: site-2 protease family protein [Oscillospiraceae bacterium]|nr:site-2 protease family protein [Oscillospiraceae bacterium]